MRVPPSYGSELEANWKLKAERVVIDIFTVVIRLLWAGVIVLVKFLRNTWRTFWGAFKGQ